MERLSCEIIMDLIPLYVENLCSEKSKEAVEMHLGECSTCMQAVKACRENSFSVRQTEHRQLDAMKKIRRKLEFQRILLGLLLLLIVGISLCLFGGNVLHMAAEAYYLFFAAAILVYIYAFGNMRDLQKAKKRDYFTALGSGMMSVYALALLVYVIQAAAAGRMPFGLKLHQVGPCVSGQFALLLVIQLALWIYGMYRILRDRVDVRAGGSLEMTGIFLLLGFERILYDMDTLEGTIWSVTSASIWVIAIGGIGCLLTLVLRQRKKR